MNLPRLLVLTDRVSTTMPLVDVVDRAVQGGARAVVLRERDLDPDERAQLADSLRSVLAPVDGLLILAGPGADAVHLNATEPVPEPRPRLVGRSCHNAVEVRRATADLCDWVTLGPWGVSGSKPGYGPPLGPDRFAELAAMSPKAFALAGVEPDDIVACRRAGAYGVAMMGAIMRAERPEQVVADVLARLAVA